MDESLSHKLASISKEYWLPIAIGVLGLMFLGYGLIYLLGSSTSTNDIVFEAGENSKNSVKKIMVDVEGAVVNPGVYSLNEDARIQDALIAASGISASADRKWIAKNLNLAAKLSDAVKIYIPNAGDDQALAGVKSASSVAGVSASGQININSSRIDELDTLSGIGPVTAQKIIDNRPYSSIDDLISKKIVSSKVFEQIKEKITAY